MPYDIDVLGELVGRMIDHSGRGFGSVNENVPHMMVGMVASETEEPSQSPDQAVGWPLFIIDEGADAFKAFVDEVLKDRFFRENVGAGAVGDQLRTTLCANYFRLRDGDIKPVVESAVLDTLRQGTRAWDVYLPVYGLRCKAAIDGGHVALLPRETCEAERERLLGLFEDRDTFDAGSAEAQAERYAGLRRVTALPDEGVEAFVRVRVESHRKHAVESAVSRGQRFLNSVRCFAPLFVGLSEHYQFGFPFECRSGRWVAMSWDPVGLDFSVDWKVQGGVVPFALDDEVTSQLRKSCGFDRLLEIWAKQDAARSDLENVLLQALQPLGRSVIAESADRRLLESVVSLERLLTPKGENCTTEKFADRLAFLLGRTLVDREGLTREAKRIYGIRSKIVHAAFGGVQDGDAAAVYGWAISSVMHVLRHRPTLTSHSELMTLLNRRKYA